MPASRQEAPKTNSNKSGAIKNRIVKGIIATKINFLRSDRNNNSQFPKFL